VTTPLKLPATFEENAYWPTLIDSVSRQAFLPSFLKAQVVTQAVRLPRYWGGALNSFSVLVHSAKLHYAADRSLGQLFADIEQYASIPAVELELEAFSLYSVPFNPSDSQKWTIRTYKLAEVPDDRIPIFPSEDFEE
jgi:hypothetical protein